MTEVPEWVRRSKVGDKLVAISNPNVKSPSNKVQKIPVGTIVTIRKIQDAPRAGGDGFTVGFCFLGIQNGILMTSSGPHEYDYHPLCFKPLTQKPTDISVFTDMLLSQDKVLEDVL